MRLRVGTSGYSYPEWKGSFYPEKIKPAEMLGFYAARLDTVEINNSFYRTPTPAVVSGWASQVPEGFEFVLKAPQKITHIRRLKDAGEILTFFLNSAVVLGPKQGPLLFQLPPNFKRDVPRLTDFLAQIPPTVRVAMEFRNASWFDDETYAVLKARGVALCIADTEGGLDTPFVATAPWGYLRLRDIEYAAADLRGWADRIREQSWSAAYVFFKHEEGGKGPAFAAEFAAAWRANG